MTIIVGLQHANGVLLGGDSAGIDKKDLQLIVRNDPKVFRNRGFIIGMTGRFRIANVLAQSSVFSQPPISDIESWIATTFIPQAQAAFEKAKWQPDEGAILVGVGDKLFQIMLEDWQYCLSSDHYQAIGSGRDLALGALHSSLRRTTCPAEQIWDALEAANHHNAGVCPPFVILDTAAPWRPTTWHTREQFVQAFRSGTGTLEKWTLNCPPPSVWDE